MKKIFLSFLLLLSIHALATHNRAGEILYKRIQPFTQIVGGEEVPLYRYLITIIKYTNDDNVNQVADRCVDTVYFGDGSVGIAPRINGTSGCGQGCPRCGEIILPDVGFRVKLNTFTITHTYSGAGNYTISSLDPNRNAGVHNMNNSDAQLFYIESFLSIDNYTGANSSPEFKNRPTDRACVYQCFYHNPGAFDIDGDSLSFEITTSRGQGGATVPGYFYPSQEGGTYSINPVTGDMAWCTPMFVDEYNLAFIVKEWRKGTDGKYRMIGYVLRDMQVIVNPCTNNNSPPNIILPPDTCVEAGTVVTKTLLVTDSEVNGIRIEGSGGAFAGPLPVATISPGYSVSSSFSVTFTWSTNCEHIRSQHYLNVFKATDSGNGVLVKFATFGIKVVPPTVKNVTATPVGSSIRIDWSPMACNPQSNPLVGYKIYRKNECSTFSFTPCKVGVDPATGFTFIGQTGPGGVSFTDTNNGGGLVVGQNYSYLVIAIYEDGSGSYGGTSVCTRLKRDIPVLLNVDVISTSATNGSVYVRWEKPLTNIGNLDTLQLPGPYHFNLKFRYGTTGNFTQLYTTTSPYFLNLGTDYTHSGINTSDSTLSYLVEFVANTSTVGSSPLATSVFLHAAPSDRRIDLSWTAKTPWNNYVYRVYRKNPSATSFSVIGTTAGMSFVDTFNVVNRAQYCYKVQSEGQYSDLTIPKPLINNSQEICAMAQDLTPPCTPTLSIDANCLSGFVKVSWTDVVPLCSDDVTKYILYYKSTVDGNYAVVDTLNSNTTSYTYDGLTLISGCYAIQALDSNGNASERSPDFCLDNCPLFELPNIFSPNGDGANDFYKAVKVRQIKEIDLQIFDRWGNLVYKTRDPYFQWDGISLLSKQLVSEGTFFYFCEVFEPRLTGIRKRSLQGYVQVVR